MREGHKKIIDAIIKKSETVCPGSLALIGVYGSAMTGDMHEKSDLDLMIVIDDERGWKLSAGFILEDEDIGYDIYCTTWESLEGDAKCPHAQLSKLFDSDIVYARDDAAKERLEGLKAAAGEVLVSDARFESVAALRKELSEHFAYAVAADTLGKMRAEAAICIYISFDIVMLSNGKYFKRGVKRNFEEVKGLATPTDFLQNVDAVTAAAGKEELTASLTALFKGVMAFSERTGKKKAPGKDDLRGTYEEMFSNWKNKMPEAAKSGNRYASFMNLASLYFMLADIGEELDIKVPDLMGDYDPADLAKNVGAFDAALAEYAKEYEKVGLAPVRYKNADEFVKEYLK